MGKQSDVLVEDGLKSYMCNRLKKSPRHGTRKDSSHTSGIETHTKDKSVSQIYVPSQSYPGLKQVCQDPARTDTSAYTSEQERNNHKVNVCVEWEGKIEMEKEAGREKM